MVATSIGNNIAWLIPLIIGIVKGALVGAAIGATLAAATGQNILQGMLTGAISGAIFGGIGFGVGQLGIKGLGITAAHALGGAASGAINASVTGTDIGMNALIGGISAGASQWMGANVSFLQDAPINGIGDILANTGKHAAIGAVVGGGISAAFGGDFGEGARYGGMTSAVAYNANCAGALLVDIVIQRTFLFVASVATILSSPQTRTNIQRAFDSFTVHFSSGKSSPQKQPSDQREIDRQRRQWKKSDSRLDPQSVPPDQNQPPNFDPKDFMTKIGRILVPLARLISRTEDFIIDLRK